jgi:hypothetical protein
VATHLSPDLVNVGQFATDCDGGKKSETFISQIRDWVETVLLSFKN